MTSLDDKAETPENEAHSIEDTAEAPAEYRLLSRELDPAEEVGTDQYPQYGDWLPVEELRDGVAIGEVHVECPSGLARALVDGEVEEGDVFAVESVDKGPTGEWQVEVDASG